MTYPYHQLSIFIFKNGAGWGGCCIVLFFVCVCVWGGGLESDFLCVIFLFFFCFIFNILAYICIKNNFKHRVNSINKKIKIIVDTFVEVVLVCV